MAKIFNNTDKVNYDQERNMSLSGWENTVVYDDIRIGRITDTVGAGIALAKMGTSIPTPFARIQLFDTAFAQVNNLGHDTDSVYGRLVSECLDFLEFIFNCGDLITIKKWNVNTEIQNLQLSTSKHQALGRCLEKFARDLNVRDIYLFYYDNVLIGGSSPYTLVYTSPNWQRLKTITNATGLAGNILFDDYSNPNVAPWPLYRRHEDFRAFLTKYIVAFRNVPNFRNSQFYQYIFKNQDGTQDPAMKALFMQNTGGIPYEKVNFVTEYNVLKDGADVDVLGLGGNDVLYLASKQLGTVTDNGRNSPVSHDYEIEPTSTRYLNNCPNGVTPLVLNDYGISSAVYLGGLPWANGTVLIRNPHEDLDKRILPGGGNVQHPYLTDADFLEDKLLKMPYTINGQAFYTFAGNTQYLLPLKPRFFEYFNIEDLNNVKNLSFSLIELGDKSVEVKLTIPIKCQTHPYIELKKVYKVQEDIVTVPPIPGFSVAIFPSYKLVDTNVPNIYSVMLHDSSQHGSLATNFYAIDANDVNEVIVAQDKRVERTPSASTYLEINSAFDLVTVNWEGATAMLVPKFKQVTPNAVAQGLTVGIDFGTTNSYISLSYNSGANPQTLEISEQEIQVLTLNEVNLTNGNYGQDYQDSFNGMISYNQAIDREFAPLLLGQQSDVKFPYRTVTCESSTFAGRNNVQLFGHINLGFNFMKEIVDLTSARYNTNIKWDLEQHNNTNIVDCENRVRAFCLQVAWMIKNKIMLSGSAATQYTAYLTFPYTMGRPLKARIESFWRDAFDKTMGNGNVTINRSTESIAPYYFMIGNGTQFTSNALNVDIGGGTTDMLFADIENRRFWYNSSLFAGNDIWGDGKQLVPHHNLDNGFVTYFEQLLNSGQLNASSDRQMAYAKYKNLVESSADLMSYIFRYDSEFNFVCYIRNSNNKLMPILHTHLAAVVYHIAQVLKAKEMTVPTTIMFSGMGAEYIHLISSVDDDITMLIKTLLAEFMGYGYNDPDRNMPQNFKVSFQACPKEVTAQGAMLQDHPSLGNIRQYHQDELYVYGIDDAPNAILYGEAETTKEYKAKAIKMFDDFIEKFLLNENITRYLRRDFAVEFSSDFIDVLRANAGMSYDVMARSKSANDQVEETLFFWPLKNGLYEASKL